jgi:type I restriction enzyme S subunit
MNKNKNLIPKLRFPEFKNEGEWEEIELKNVTEIIMGSSPSSIFYNENREGLPLLQGNADIKNRLSSPRIYTSEITKECEIDDILLSVRAPVGTIAKSIHKACIGRGISAIRAKNHNSQEFIYQWLFSYEDNWINISQGGTFDAVNSDDIRNLKLPIPQFLEQQKIASCLSSLDEVIAEQRQKLELLKQHKKGLMQNLFPQEGEKVPKIRFKEFENDGEWVDKELGELIELKGRIGYRGYTLEDIVGKGEGAISMSPSNINEFGTLSFTKSTYITWAKYEESPEIILQNGFTVLVKTGSTFGKVAFIKNLNEKTTINPQLVVLKPKKVDKYFLYLLVSNASIQKQINETVVGGAIPTLSQESISKFEILVPKTKEQEKIADCLSSLDGVIAAQTDNIEQLKLHKKGLMQNLFPKVKD